MSSKGTPKRKRIKKGAGLPYYERAMIDPRKLTEYALKPDNEAKAKGFATLGVFTKDWRYAHDEILAQLPHAEATHVDIRDPALRHFTVRVPFRGLNGKEGTVLTGWTIDSRCEPWLTTCFFTSKPR